MTVPSQIFTLFYAVLYGALFTITDKWRPLMGTAFSPRGWNRLLLSVALYGLAPVLYFVLAFTGFQGVRTVTPRDLLLSIYCVAPLVFFHFCWIWMVAGEPDCYYEKDPWRSTIQELVEQTKAGGAYNRLIFVVVCLVLLLVAPLAIIILQLCHQAAYRDVVLSFIFGLLLAGVAFTSWARFGTKRALPRQSEPEKDEGEDREQDTR